jgi:regulatory protein YycH of two-component signal transduction system YycFG
MFFSAISTLKRIVSERCTYRVWKFRDSYATGMKESSFTSIKLENENEKSGEAVQDRVLLIDKRD